MILKNMIICLKNIKSKKLETPNKKNQNKQYEKILKNTEKY